MKNILLLLMTLLLLSCHTDYHTYKSRLTKDEKLELAQKGTLVKMHTHYHKSTKLTTVGKLKVEKQGGKYKFISIGDWHQYYSDDKIASIQSFDDQGIHHLLKIYSPNGSLEYYEKANVDSVDGQRVLVFESIAYHTNGQVYKNEPYYLYNNKSFKHGTWVTYDSTGVLKSKKVFNSGKIIE